MSSTPRELAEKIGLEYHKSHPAVPNEWPMSWDPFESCTHEICEGSRELIQLLKDVEQIDKYFKENIDVN